MDVVYLVKAYMGISQKEKSILYNGQSAREAFELLEAYNKQSEISVEIFENGSFVKRITQ